jgi:hypothetical protein
MPQHKTHRATVVSLLLLSSARALRALLSPPALADDGGHRQQALWTMT